MAPTTAVDELRRALNEAAGVRLAVLFGSAARGADVGDSDLDVGVLNDAAASLLGPQDV